jgi:hypothetical protein
MTEYRFDRSSFKMQSFEDADRANVFDKSVPYAERLRQAYFLIAQAYGFSIDNEPRMDKTIFSCRKNNK